MALPQSVALDVAPQPQPLQLLDILLRDWVGHPPLLIDIVLLTPIDVYDAVVSILLALP
jgi:hypothetical protein